MKTKKLHKLSIRIALVALLLFVFCSNNYATTYYWVGGAGTSGSPKSWNTGANWSTTSGNVSGTTGTVPGSGDVAIFDGNSVGPNGTNVNPFIDVSGLLISIGSIKVTYTGVANNLVTLVNSATSITLSGDLTIDAKTSAICTLANGGNNISVGGNLTNTGLNSKFAVISGTGAVIMTGANPSICTTTAAYLQVSNLTIGTNSNNCVASLATTGDYLTIQNNFTITNGKFTITKSGNTATAYLFIGGVGNNAAASATAATVSMTPTNCITNTSASYGKIVISSTQNIGNLYFDQTTANTTNAISQFTIQAGSATIANNLLISGTSTLAGNLTLGANTTLTTKGATYTYTSGGIDASNSTSTYNIAYGLVTIPAGWFSPANVANLQLSSTSATTDVTLNQAITITNSLTFSGTSSLINNGASNLTMANGSTINRSYANTGTITTNSPVFGSLASDRVNINIGAACTSGKELLGTPGGISNLTTSANYTLASSPTINGTLTLTAGTLTTTGQTLSLGNSASVFKAYGSLSAAPTFGTLVNVTYGGTSTTQTGTTTNTSTSVILSASNANIYAGMPVSGTGIANGTIVSVISGTNLTLSQAATADGTNPLSFGSAQTTSNELPTSATVLNNLTINNASGVTLNALTTVNGTLTLSSGVLATGANTLTLNGAISGTGTINTSTTGTLVFGGSSEQTLDGGNVTSGTVNNLVINAGSKLTTTGTLSATNLTINSTTDGGTGSITGTLKGTLTSTNASVNQYLTNRTWYLSSPVSSATPANMSVIKYFNETVPGNVWPDATTMTAGTGYLVTPNSSTFANNILFSGTLNTGSQPITLTRSTNNTDYPGFNLIGNPYPAYLDWTAVCNYTTDGGTTYSNQTIMPTTTMWYRTKATGSWGFVTVNGAGVTSPTGVVTKYIPPMQAFWVRTITGGGSLQLTNNMCSHIDGVYNTSPNTLKAPAAKNAEQLQLVRLQVNNGTITDEAVIYFSANANNGFDIYDAPKMINSDITIPGIYTLLNNEQIVINAMNTIPLNQEISLGFVPGSASSFSIKANEISNLPSGVKLILKDNVSNVETDLTDGITGYNFSSETSTDSRFSVIFRSSSSVTGTVNNTDTNNISIYINANNQIGVNCSSDINDNAFISVYNALGQKLESKQISSTTTVIDKTFNSGVYVVTVISGGKSITKKIILN